MSKGTAPLLLVPLAFFAALAPGCKRANVGYALSPWDATEMTACHELGPLARSCNECNHGDVKACLAIAGDFERRHDLDRTPASEHVAALFFGRACELNYMPACALLGDHYAVVRAEPNARQDAVKLRDASCPAAATACAGKDALACRVEGLCHDNGWTAPRKTPRDPAAATRAYASACDLGDAVACAQLGWLRAAGGSESALPDALAAYQKACDADSATGCVAVASFLQHGLGAPADPARAGALLGEWCSRGSVEACHAESGHHAALWPLLRPDPKQAGWPAPDPKRLAALDLQVAWTQGLGRTGFCVEPTGAVDKITTLDSVGDPALDQVLRDTVATWKFTPPPAGAPMCLSYEHNFVFAVRPWLFRAYYVVTDQWISARGGVTQLDHDWQRPARTR